MLGDTIVWSSEESARIARSGFSDEELRALDTTSSAQGKISNLTPHVSDPLVQNAQIDWITKAYCRENKGVLIAILEAFTQQSKSGEQFTEVGQLRMSHFHELVAMKREDDNKRQLEV